MAFKTSRIITTVVTGAIFVIPEGANQMFIYNIGGAAGAFRSLGKKLFNISSVQVTLPQGANFGFDYNGKAYDSIEVDATGTIIEVVAIY